MKYLETVAYEILMVPVFDWAILFVSSLHTVQVKKELFRKKVILQMSEN